MAENKNQHYVPQLHLKKFSADEKSIGVYHIPSDRFVQSSPIKHEASEDYFYGKDSSIDERLRKIESAAGKLIKEIIGKSRLPDWNTYEHFELLQFVLTLRFRTVYAKEGHNERFSDTWKFFISKRKDYDEELWTNLKVVDTNASQISVQNALLALPIVSDLDFKLLRNKTKIPFWTSDNPTVLYNQFLEKKRPGLNNTGLVSKGLQIFLPNFSKLLFVFYDKETYKVGLEQIRIIQVTENDVRQLNKLQFISANEKLYFDKSFREREVKDFCHSFAEEREKGRHNYKSEVLKDTGKMAEIMKMMPEVKASLTLNFVRTSRIAEQYIIGNKIVIPRSKRAIEMHNFVQSEAKRLSELSRNNQNLSGEL